MNTLVRVLTVKRGFTLIELLVALVILAIVTASFLGLFYTGVFGIGTAGRRSSNINLSQEQIERLIRTGASSPDTLKIELPSGSEVFVDGQAVVIENENVTLRTFVPKK